MESGLEINVANLDAGHRRALEEVIGRELASNVRVIVSVIEVGTGNAAKEPAQTLEDWARVYDGLSDDEVQEIDAIANTRANLTRDLP